MIPESEPGIPSTTSPRTIPTKPKSKQSSPSSTELSTLTSLASLTPTPRPTDQIDKGGHNLRKRKRESNVGKVKGRKVRGKSRGPLSTSNSVSIVDAVDNNPSGTSRRPQIFSEVDLDHRSEASIGSGSTGIMIKNMVNVVLSHGFSYD